VTVEATEEKRSPVGTAAVARAAMEAATLGMEKTEEVAV